MKRLFVKRDLEMILGSICPHSHPDILLEQYSITPEIASEILYIAGCIFDDIDGKKVLDLGCGTGRLSIGASIIGAKDVVGIDIDQLAIFQAKKNQKNVNVPKIQWIISDIMTIRGKFDTVIQNPPFGVKRKGADRRFIKKALEVAEVIYSLHNSCPKNRAFIKRFVKQHGGRISDLFQLEFRIPWTFPFHLKKSR